MLLNPYMSNLFEITYTYCKNKILYSKLLQVIFYILSVLSFIGAIIYDSAVQGFSIGIIQSFLFIATGNILYYLQKMLANSSTEDSNKEKREIELSDDAKNKLIRITGIIALLPVSIIIITALSWAYLSFYDLLIPFIIPLAITIIFSAISLPTFFFLLYKGILSRYTIGKVTIQIIKYIVISIKGAVKFIIYITSIPFRAI